MVRSVSAALRTLDPLGSSLAANLREFLSFELPPGSMDSNHSLDCFANCNKTCENGTCICPCAGIDVSFAAAFASLSYLLFLVATIQLVLCMVHDALSGDKAVLRWKKAFRVTTQKCLLGAVMGATGTRAIYYTVQHYIPEHWADILLNLYYPALLSAFSLLILFWAEFFYHSLPADGHDFLKKHRYSMAFAAFNAVVYLLLVADVIATPLVKDEQEQARKSGIISSIFALLLFVMLVGFLHLAIRLFFRPDLQPLSVQLAVLKINLRQQAASCAGIVSNALMQSMIIVLLMLNMVSRFQKVDSYSLYVGAIIIRVTELCLPIWFCCSLWNTRQPKRLWILNPSLLLKLSREQQPSDSESGPLLQSGSSTNSDYGTFSSLSTDLSREVPDPRREGEEEEDGWCWICQDDGDPQDLFYPCKCRLHRRCLKEWVTRRASNVNTTKREYLKCQVCGEKDYWWILCIATVEGVGKGLILNVKSCPLLQYRTKNKGCVCLPRGLERRHWIQATALVLVLVASVLIAVYVGTYKPLKNKIRIAIIASIVVVDAVLLKLTGCGLMWMCRRSKVTLSEIVGTSVKQDRTQKERIHLQVSTSVNGTVVPCVCHPSIIEVHSC